MHVDPMKPVLKASGSVLLKLRCDGPLSSVAFNLYLRRCTKEYLRRCTKECRPRRFGSSSDIRENTLGTTNGRGLLLSVWRNVRDTSNEANICGYNKSSGERNLIMRVC